MLVLFLFSIRSAEFALLVSDNFFLISSSWDLFSTPYFNNEIAFDAGPKIGWYLSDKIDSNLPADFGEEGSQYNVKVTAHHSMPVSRKFDYGIQAGLGYEFKFGPKVSLQLQGRYYYGLANIWPDTKADEFEQSSNQSIQIVAALWWHHTIRGKKVRREPIL